jgi:hypothetical protein
MVGDGGDLGAITIRVLEHPAAQLSRINGTKRVFPALVEASAEAV